MSERVVLLNRAGKPIGTCEKLLAHRHGWLHRAFSVFVFDQADRLILQKRAIDKYHSGGLWSNTCCGHPRPQENIQQAAERRLFEEMGLTCTLREIDRFEYRAQLNNGMLEHELDHVFVGTTNQVPKPDKVEVAAWMLADVRSVRHLLGTAPLTFTAWFAPAFRAVLRQRGRDLIAGILPEELTERGQLGEQQNP